MLSSPRSPQTLPFVFWPKLLTLGLLTVFCWMLAQWTWLIAAPQSPLMPPPSEAAADLAAALTQITTSGLFTTRTDAVQAEVSAPTALNLKLVGIVAATPRREQSLAVLNLNNKGNEVVREGSEIAAGIVVDHISKNHVVIRRQGLQERVEFPNLASGAGTPAAFKIDMQRQGDGQFSFSRENLNRALQEPEQLAQLGRFSVTPGSGVVIEQAPAGSLAQKLGLQDGDVIAKVNGETVSKPEDILRLYQKFALSGQVVLEGARRGAALKQTYTVNP